jgi:hypothetical protein
MCISLACKTAVRKPDVPVVRTPQLGPPFFMNQYFLKSKSVTRWKNMEFANRTGLITR